MLTKQKEFSVLEDKKLRTLNVQLAKAVKEKNKRWILNLYEMYRAVDIPSANINNQNSYDALVDKANNILYS